MRVCIRLNSLGHRRRVLHRLLRMRAVGSFSVSPRTGKDVGVEVRMVEREEILGFDNCGFRLLVGCRTRMCCTSQPSGAAGLPFSWPRLSPPRPQEAADLAGLCAWAAPPSPSTRVRCRGLGGFTEPPPLWWTVRPVSSCILPRPG